MKNIRLDHAIVFAELMRKALAGRVERVEVAGSVRRGTKELVSNIDLVLIPKPDSARADHTLPFFFRDQMTRLTDGNGSPERVIHFANLTFRPIPHDSTPNLFVLETVYNQEEQMAEGVRVNVAVATEENWGSVMLFRTGNRSFNRYIGYRAKSQGLLWSPFSDLSDPPEGIFHPQTKVVVAARDEEEIFKALKLKFVQPKDRERVK